MRTYISSPVTSWLRLSLGAALLALGGSASAVTIDWLPVGTPGNAGDPTPMTCCSEVTPTSGYGAVAYTYFISKFEVTNAQYAEFLNAKAAVDPLGLYNPQMTANFNGGITRSGVSGSYTYAAKPGYATKPVNFVSYYDALRFANWLNNGQGVASTETGAYTLLGGSATPTNASVGRNPLAITFVTSENEWYKAAYFNGTSYLLYPAGSSTATTCSAPTAVPNRANCGFQAGFSVSNAGAYTGSAGPYGTFDQGGNIGEWNDGINPVNHVFRGGSWGVPTGNQGLAASYRASTNSTAETDYLGFRVASLAPEPSTAILLATGLVGLATRRREPIA